MALAIVDEKEVSCLVPQKILPELPPPVMLEEESIAADQIEGL